MFEKDIFSGLNSQTPKIGVDSKVGHFRDQIFSGENLSYSFWMWWQRIKIVTGCKENLVVFQNMIMVMISEWSWPWSRNYHDQHTLIMGDVCDHWSSLERAQQCRDLSLKIAKPLHVEYQATALKTEPALWSEWLLKLDREPVLSQNNQLANPSHLTKSRSGSNFTTSSAHLGPQLQERSTLYFFARPKQPKQICQTFILLQLRGRWWKSKQAKPEQWYDKERALDNVPCEDMWHFVCGKRVTTSQCVSVMTVVLVCILLHLLFCNL